MTTVSAALLALVAVQAAGSLERQAFRAYQQRDWAAAVRLYDQYHAGGTGAGGTGAGGTGAGGAGTASTYDNLGVALTSLGRLRQAEAALERALQLDPRHRWAYNHLGFVYRQQGRRQEAIRMFERQIEISPKDPYAYRNLAGTLAEEGRLEEAEAAAAEHEKRTYERGAVWIDLACALNTRKQPEAAHQYLERAAAAGVDRALVAQERAHYFLTVGDLDQAEQQYRKLAEYRPYDPAPSLRLGTLYFQLGELEKAADAFGRVITVDERDRVTIRTSANTSREVTLDELRAQPSAAPLGDLPVDLARAALLVRAAKFGGAACEELAAVETRLQVRSWCATPR